MPAKSMKMAREYEIASSKRPRFDDEDSDTESVARGDRDDTSDFEESTKQPKKRTQPPAKRQKTEKVEEKIVVSKRSKAATVVNDQMPPRLPKWAQCSAGVKFFTPAWWKEISPRDGFWEEFHKRIPKGVLAKRLSVHIAHTLDDPNVKEEGGDDGKSKAKVGRPPKKSSLNTTKGTKIEKVGKKTPAKVEDESDSPDNESDDDDEVVVSLTKSLTKSTPLRRMIPEDAARKSPSTPKPAETPISKAQTNAVESDDEADCVIIGTSLSPSKKNATTPDLPAKSIMAPNEAEGANKPQETSKECNNSPQESAKGDATSDEVSEINETSKEVVEVPVEAPIEEVHESIERAEQQEDPVSGPVQGNWQPDKF